MPADIDMSALPCNVKFSDLQLFRRAQERTYCESPSEESVSPVSSELKKRSRKKVSEAIPPQPPVRKLPHIIFGEYDIQSLYHSSYPREFDYAEKIYICELCLKFMRSGEFFKSHQSVCRWLNPPGDEIYRKDGLSVFEVDGRTSELYCINLCLLSKLFLKDKVLFYDVEPFLFYVLCRYDRGFRLVGYFSKPKCAGECNLSCVMVLPPYQRSGYGRFLIDFSYFLSRYDGTWGTPDKPLSQFGQLAYYSYWKSAILQYFHRLNSKNVRRDGVSIHQIRAATGISAPDVVNTLVKLRFLRKISHYVYPSGSGFVLDIDWNLVRSTVALNRNGICIDPLAFKPSSEYQPSVSSKK